MEVDDAAPLELGDLDERHPAPLRQLADSEPELAGEDAAQDDGEPSPQLGGVPVEGDVPRVVVAVTAARCAEPVVVLAGCDGRIRPHQDGDSGLHCDSVKVAATYHSVTARVSDVAAELRATSGLSGCLLLDGTMDWCFSPEAYRLRGW